MESLFVTYKKLIISMLGVIAVTLSIGTIFKIMHYPLANQLLIIGILMTIVIYIVTLIDMIKSPIRNKVIWIIALTISQFITCILYLRLREKFLIN